MSSEDEDSDLSIINPNSPYNDEDSFLTRPDVQRSHAALRLVVAGDEDVQPASHHALTVAYDSLKKRYNQLQHEYRSVVKQKTVHRLSGSKTVTGLQQESSKMLLRTDAIKASNHTVNTSTSAYSANAGSIGAFVVQQSQQNNEKHKQILLEELEKVQRRNKDLESVNERLKLENEKLQRELRNKSKTEVSRVLRQDSGDGALVTIEQYMEASNNAKAVLHMVRSLKQAATQLNSSLLARCLEKGVLQKPSLGVSTAGGGSGEASEEGQCELGTTAGTEVEEQVATLAIGTPTAVCSPPLYDTTGYTMTSPQTAVSSEEGGRSLDGSTMYFDDTDGAAEEDSDEFLTMPESGNVPFGLTANAGMRKSGDDTTSSPYRPRGLADRAQAAGLNIVSPVAEVRPLVRSRVAAPDELTGSNGVLNEEPLYQNALSISERVERAAGGMRRDQKCPVCLSTFAFLSQVDFEQHVNDCIDRKLAAQQEDEPATMTNVGNADIRMTTALHGSASYSVLQGRLTESASGAEGSTEPLQCEDCGTVYTSALAYLQHREQHCTDHRENQQFTGSARAAEGVPHTLQHGRYVMQEQVECESLSERQCPVCGETFDATTPQSVVDIHVNRHFINDDLLQSQSKKSANAALNL